MNKWIAIGFFLLLACQLGDGLECYECEFGTCTFPKTKSCSFLEVCLTQTARFKDLYLKKKSCATPEKCIGETEDTYLGLKVTKSPSCCATDLCNSAVKASTSAITVTGVLLSVCVAWFL